MTQNGPRCKKCGGSLYRDEDGRKCLSCGQVWRTKAELHQFYQDHRPEILATVRKLGVTKAADAWQIPQGSINKILSNWGEPETPPVTENVNISSESNSPGSDRRAAAAPEESIIRSNVTMPAFPEFRDDWPQEVQLVWLETYGKLVKSQGGR